jgi:hypothetical protein
LTPPAKFSHQNKKGTTEMTFVVEIKFLIRLIVIIASLLIAVLGILGIFVGFVNLARLYPATIFICVIVGYVLAVIGTRVLFPARND